MESSTAHFPEVSKGTASQELFENLLRKTEEEAEGVPLFIRELAKGKCEAIDFEVPLEEKPLWLDEEKFRRGQKFASDHLYGLIYSEMLSLLMLFAFKPILKVLISTGQSSTPYKSFRRYLGTAQKIVSWYEKDVWCGGEARTNMAIVRMLHRSVFNKLQEVKKQEIAEKTTLENSLESAIWSISKDALAEDFKEFCASDPAYTYLRRTPEVIWVSQLDMAMTQFGFVGLAVTFPKYFGFHNTTDEELDDFIYMWRTLGYFLGIKDRYNFCNGDLSIVRQRSKEIIDGVVKPAFREIDADREFMSRCLVRGVGLCTSRESFESSVLYQCHVLHINVPRFRKSVSFKNYSGFYTRRFLFLLARIPLFANYFNKSFKQEMRKIEKIPSEALADWKPMGVFV